MERFTLLSTSLMGTPRDPTLYHPQHSLQDLLLGDISSVHDELVAYGFSYSYAQPTFPLVGKGSTHVLPFLGGWFDTLREMRPSPKSLLYYIALSVPKQ